jgi:hypothetical protein
MARRRARRGTRLASSSCGYGSKLDKEAAARIVTRAPGYAIEISADELDASQFETLTRETGEAVRAGRWPQAGRTAAHALELWRGEALADVPSQSLRDRWVPHLDQLRVQALEWRIEADLHDGRHEQLVPELRNLTDRHRLREHFHGQLMLALYRCGRQAEALAAFLSARDILVAELGVEPGPGLRDLHQRMLAADPALAAGIAGMGPAGAPGSPQGRDPAIPRQLPAGIWHFTGREAELNVLTVAPGKSAGQHAAVILAISGMAGVAAECQVLVTSRSQLTGLIALDGAIPVPVGLLTEIEARNLLARRLGDRRVAREQQEAAELIALSATRPAARLRRQVGARRGRHGRATRRPAPGS